MTSSPDSNSTRPDDPPPFPDFPVERTDRLYDSTWCGLRRELLRLPDGAQQEYHVVEIPDAVAVIPELSDGRFVLIWQHRHPNGRTHWEVPAGRIHAGEDPEEAARRELREETGHAAGRLEPLGGFFPINGISDHYCHVFVARDCRAVGEPELEAAERLVTRTFARHTVVGMLRDDVFQDGFTALALAKLLLAEGALGDDAG